MTYSELQMSIENVATPALVLHCPAHGSLGVIRSLGRLGIPVYAVHQTARVPALASRYCRGSFLWDAHAAPPKQTVEYLLEIGRTIGRRSILIPTSTDDMAIFVAEHAAALREWYIFPDQSPALARALASKKEMFHLVKKVGIPTAETLFPRSREEVCKFLKSATFPIMLKGIDGMLLYQKTGKKMVIVHDQQELLRSYDAMEDPQQPNLMLQEYIPGGDDTIWMFNGYFNASSECLVGFTGKKLRQVPIHVGSTSLGICLANPAVDKLTREFMKAIGYKGTLDIGYRYDTRDGTYKVLDVNPRVGGTFRLFVGQNGLDVIRALYLDLTGQRVPASGLREGRKWMVEDSDLGSSFRYYREGQLTLSEWLRSFRGVEEAAFFASDDLRPFLRACAQGVRLISSRLFRAAQRLASGQPVPGKAAGSGFDFPVTQRPVAMAPQTKVARS
jgi:predicted ATP-grasp superfamily ATP-dependent carboligase